MMFSPLDNLFGSPRLHRDLIFFFGKFVAVGLLIGLIVGYTIGYKYGTASVKSLYEEKMDQGYIQYYDETNNVRLWKKG